MGSSFIDRCISGDAFLDEIDDYIDSWHDDGPENVELHEYLGMTVQEYSLWITTPSILASIVDARMQGNELEKVSHQDVYALAARASSTREAHLIMDWLRRIGKLNEA